MHEDGDSGSARGIPHIRVYTSKRITVSSPPYHTIPYHAIYEFKADGSRTLILVMCASNMQLANGYIYVFDTEE